MEFLWAIWPLDLCTLMVIFFLISHQSFLFSNLCSFPLVLLLCPLKENPILSSLQGPVRHLQMAINSLVSLLFCRTGKSSSQPLYVHHVLQVPEHPGGPCWIYFSLLLLFLPMTSPNWTQSTDTVSQILKREKESLFSACWLLSC